MTRPRLLHGEARDRPGGGRGRRHHRPVSETSAGSPRPRATRSATSPSASSTGPARGLGQGGTAGRRTDHVHQRRRCGRRHHGRRDGTGIDLLLGIGGTPEGIIAACAIICLGGTFQGKLWPRDDAERHKAIDAGHDLDRVLTTRDLVASDNVFFVATGITTASCCGGALPGRWRADGIDVMRSKSGTIRLIDSTHSLTKLKAYSSVDFEGGRPAGSW